MRQARLKHHRAFCRCWMLLALFIAATIYRLGVTWDFRNARRGGFLTEVTVQRDYARYENSPQKPERFREPPVAVFYN